ncbi:MAG: helix-turn-helix transcriptional regulator [Oscillospiraceae bacterium]|nr:helix-turn-helix transcriptional regulator [Oscillospiraceae bacterium]
MEFCEKLRELRKIRGLTQEELAEILYVSRTAVSKWESGRGYPSIDSLKEISNYFSVTIDDLLSAEKLIFIAEKENQTNIDNICRMLFGFTDLFSVIFIVFPLYPKNIDNYIFSVNLFEYTETSEFNLAVYWIMFILLILTGIFKLLLTHFRIGKLQKSLTACSVIINILAVIILALAGETYPVTVAFLLLLAKGFLFIRQTKSGF